MKNKAEIRNADAGDAPRIAEIMVPYSKDKLLLPRPPEEILKHIDNFCVAVLDGRVIGCCALRNYGAGLYEVRSLAVEQGCTNTGTGSLLVKFCMEKAASKGKARVFALTYRAALFRRLGFFTVSKTLFPQKIWSDCSVCAKKDKCDEEAVMIEL